MQRNSLVQSFDTSQASDVDASASPPSAGSPTRGPSTWAPLFVTLGAAEEELSGRRTVIDGYWLGMAKRSIQTG